MVKTKTKSRKSSSKTDSKTGSKTGSKSRTFSKSSMRNEKLYMDYNDKRLKLAKRAIGVTGLAGLLYGIYNRKAIKEAITSIRAKNSVMRDKEKSK